MQRGASRFTFMKLNLLSRSGASCMSWHCVVHSSSTAIVLHQDKADCPSVRKSRRPINLQLCLWCLAFGANAAPGTPTDARQDTSTAEPYFFTLRVLQRCPWMHSCRIVLCIPYLHVRHLLKRCFGALLIRMFVWKLLEGLKRLVVH